MSADEDVATVRRFAHILAGQGYGTELHRVADRLESHARAEDVLARIMAVVNTPDWSSDKVERIEAILSEAAPE